MSPKTSLRKKAEKKLPADALLPDNMSGEELRSLIHELQVHQIELEIQNEELRKAQQEAADSQQRYADLYNYAPVGYLTLDKYGMTLEANHTAAHVLGIPRGHLVNKPFRLWIIASDRDAFTSHLQEVFRHPEKRVCKVRLRGKDESEFYTQLESITVQDLNGNEVCRTSITDITGLKRAEEALKEANEKLRKQAEDLALANRELRENEQRLLARTKELEQARELAERRTAEFEAANREIETFSYSVSHDLRAPLRSIDGFSKMLLEDYKDKLDDAGWDYLNRVRNSAQRMAALIDAMLSLSRLTRDEPQLAETDLAIMARDIVGELTSTNPDRYVEFVIPEKLIVFGDPTMLQVALQNLLSNSWKFTAEHPRARIEFGGRDEGGEKVYFVKDDGAGFNMEYADKLFGAFQRLHGQKEFPGIGIGLATVQRIIHKHGGRIWAEAEEEKGAAFYFTLGTKRK